MFSIGDSVRNRADIELGPFKISGKKRVIKKGTLGIITDLIGSFNPTAKVIFGNEEVVVALEELEKDVH